MIKRGTTQSDKNLITTCFNIRKTHHVSLMRYVFDERYANQCKKQIHSVPQNGVTDSVRTLLTNYNEHSKQILKMLLSPFQWMCNLCLLFLDNNYQFSLIRFLKCTRYFKFSLFSLSNV